MLNFYRNNLDKAVSPYLRQHQDNPIWWQEWSPQALAYAKEHNKLLFVSVGYATCHWCHVMAAEAFSNQEIADYLNQHFVSIKVDREQRPDIDQYLMSFMVETQGQGGWPLNVILSPDRKPLYAATYVPAEPRAGMPGLRHLLEMVRAAYERQKGQVLHYLPQPPSPSSVEGENVIAHISRRFDHEHGGFAGMQKFPPHNTLLFLLHYAEGTGNAPARKMVEQTLDAMMMRGLHDHLQGGFFRYCVDRAWTIPHFEKMLYDQAMMLWVFSAAYKVLGKPAYRTVAEKLVACLEETFEEDGLFHSAHDADTDHEEGATYLWSKKELEQVLTPAEYKAVAELYEITEQGNFEGKNHLIKRAGRFLPEIEQKLLHIRKQRPQPFVDRKIVTSWNALAGIGLLMAERHAGIGKGKRKAVTIFERLLAAHYHGRRLAHSSLDGELQKGEFLGDYAGMLLLATYFFEETGRGKDIIEEFAKRLEIFRTDNQWIENKTADFIPVPAQPFDHPAPSSVSLAEMALLRARIVQGKEYQPCDYRQPLEADFHNLVAWTADGGVHVVQSPEPVSWAHLPLNAIQVRGRRIQDCYRRRCREFDTADELVRSLASAGVR